MGAYVVTFSPVLSFLAMSGGAPKRFYILGARCIAFIVAICVFILNTLTQFHDAFAVLYVLVVFLVADTCGVTIILLTSAGCIALACTSFLLKHYGEPLGGPYARLAVSIVAIGVAAQLSARNRRTRTLLSEQVRMLALTHDTVIIRDQDDTITYWNDGAVHLYGWREDEAVGKKSSDLLGRSPLPAHAAHDLKSSGQWNGEITRNRRSGETIVIDTRWIVRIDSDGRECGVIEFGADLTEQRKATAERERSEQRYSAIFQAVGSAIFEVDCSVMNILIKDWETHSSVLWDARVDKFQDYPYIRDANGAAALLLGASSPQDLTGNSLRSLFKDQAVFREVLRQLALGYSEYEIETTFNGSNNATRDVFLRVTRPLNDVENRHVLVMALDITERNEAQMKLRVAQSELAHADRVTTLGQLAISIAHEVNQPLSAIITFARSGQRWLKRPQADINEALSCFDQIVRNGTRAGEIIKRVRSLTRKEPASRALLSPAVLLEEVILLLRGELSSKNVELRVMVSPGLPAISGDKVQIQQVIMNLMMNAIQAMMTITERPRLLDIMVADGESGSNAIRMTFEDSGPGFSCLDPTELFEPFVTTKTQGMGMGLSICREIITSHGGTIEAKNRVPCGANVTVMLNAAGSSHGN
ncbi:ATP-binding protein [Komagataeibacter xylinus]|uniref:PAS domain-containing sensor histidine kinase n=1 Tax=Komagataeibacter xylinus TaxID=28448 RepID=UPI001F0EADDA|nr:ATP-binding protein [Komagataeibacter xylinus]